ncbi:MAG TPA: RNA-binding cell elongation regulator Jag/EloR [Candidatus Izemoplasmatales bacterium]|nr:RNA-binding cell elongation regulator Jag/EloR [Bacillota bacterium]HRY77971.1 RNA-binding cell elongation regulator Jag/EloR [Candidatus Izemoplasmatales bacterium]
MKTFRFETKVLNDDTLKYAADELKISQEFVSLKVVEEKRNILGLNKSYVVEAVVNFDPINDSIRFLQQILADMEIEALIEARQEEDHNITFKVNAEENPILIGRNGKTLDAIQTLLKNYINVYTDEHYVVLVDIGGYKEQRRKQLEILATKTAKEVAKTHVPVRLNKMNAYERRIIHTKLADWRDVTTESEGEEPNRYVVIRPKAR